MSTILDALKKSEKERKLNKLPTLTDIAAPQEPSRWPMIIGVTLAVLAAALVVLAYLLWNGKPAVIEAQSNNDQQGFIQPGASTNARAASTIVGQQGAIGKQAQTDPANGEILVNVVVYSDDPALRFAMVNGKLVREGEFVDTGIKVDEIKFDAVVFNVRGEKVIRRP